MTRRRLIIGNWTQAREAWLARLERAPAVRERGTVGYQCAALGWSDRVRDAAGELLEPYEETLTDKGRAKLAEWRALDDARRR